MQDDYLHNVLHVSCCTATHGDIMQTNHLSGRLQQRAYDKMARWLNPSSFYYFFVRSWTHNIDIRY